MAGEKLCSVDLNSAWDPMDFRISAATDSTVMSDWDLEKRNKWLQYQPKKKLIFFNAVVQTGQSMCEKSIHIQQVYNTRFKLIALSRQLEAPESSVCPSVTYLVSTSETLRSRGKSTLIHAWWFFVWIL